MLRLGHQGSRGGGLIIVTDKLSRGKRPVPLLRGAARSSQRKDSPVYQGMIRDLSYERRNLMQEVATVRVLLAGDRGSFLFTLIARGLHTPYEGITGRHRTTEAMRGDTSRSLQVNW